MTFEAFLKVISEILALYHQRHDQSHSHLDQVHDVVVGHLGGHDGFDLGGF